MTLHVFGGFPYKSVASWQTDHQGVSWALQDNFIDPFTGGREGDAGSL
jgi:hypothetical protein